jgi:hypothetical protein
LHWIQESVTFFRYLVQFPPRSQNANAVPNADASHSVLAVVALRNLEVAHHQVVA